MLKRAGELLPSEKDGSNLRAVIDEIIWRYCYRCRVFEPHCCPIPLLSRYRGAG